MIDRIMNLRIFPLLLTISLSNLALATVLLITMTQDPTTNLVIR